MFPYWWDNIWIVGLFQISSSETEEVALQINQNLLLQIKCLQASLGMYQKSLSEMIFGHLNCGFIFKKYILAH